MKTNERLHLSPANYAGSTLQVGKFYELAWGDISEFRGWFSYRGELSLLFSSPDYVDTVFNLFSVEFANVTVGRAFAIRPSRIAIPYILPIDAIAVHTVSNIQIGGHYRLNLGGRDTNLVVSLEDIDSANDTAWVKVISDEDQVAESLPFDEDGLVGLDLRTCARDVFLLLASRITDYSGATEHLNIGGIELSYSLN